MEINLTENKTSQNLGNSWSLLLRNAKDAGANSVLATNILYKSKIILDEGDHTVVEMLSSVSSIESKLVDLEKFSSRIHSLAEQAKFLSLNAYIEAARAGEHGKTFAVVADELGDLTKEVRNLTVKIDHLLKEVNDSVEQNRVYCNKMASTFKIVNNELYDFQNLMKKIEELSVHQSQSLENLKI